MAQSHLDGRAPVATIGDLGEGGSLAHVITNQRGRTLMILGSAYFSASDLARAGPDVFILSAAGKQSPKITAPFREMVGQPSIVVASH
jgi:hypothetical protein